MQRPAAQPATDRRPDRAGRRDVTALLADATSRIGELTAKMAYLAAVRVPDVDEVAISVIHADSAPTIAFSGSRAAALDGRLHEADFGPAWTRRAPVVS